MGLTLAGHNTAQDVGRLAMHGTLTPPSTHCPYLKGHVFVDDVEHQPLLGTLQQTGTKAGGRHQEEVSNTRAPQPFVQLNLHPPQHMHSCLLH